MRGVVAGPEAVMDPNLVNPGRDLLSGSQRAAAVPGCSNNPPGSVCDPHRSLISLFIPRFATSGDDFGHDHLQPVSLAHYTYIFHEKLHTEIPPAGLLGCYDGIKLSNVSKLSFHFYSDKSLS